jgi:hypothetical protein
MGLVLPSEGLGIQATSVGAGGWARSGDHHRIVNNPSLAAMITAWGWPGMLPFTYSVYQQRFAARYDIGPFPRRNTRVRLSDLGTM